MPPLILKRNGESYNDKKSLIRLAQKHIESCLTQAPITSLHS